MKKILLFVIATIGSFGGILLVDASSSQLDAAKFLSEKKVIENSNNFQLESTITRREMLKVMMNLSGGMNSNQECTGTFVDLPKSDWGCKYAEAAMKKGFITSTEYFRPNDSVTYGEALKMIMQAKGIPSDDGNGTITNWQYKYELGAMKNNILPNVENGTKIPFYENAKRGSIFLWSARANGGFTYGNKGKYITQGISINYPDDWWHKDLGNGEIQFGQKSLTKYDFTAIIKEKLDGTELDYIPVGNKYVSFSKFNSWPVEFSLSDKPKEGYYFQEEGNQIFFYGEGVLFNYSKYDNLPCAGCEVDIVDKKNFTAYQGNWFMGDEGYYFGTDSYDLAPINANVSNIETFRQFNEENRLESDGKMTLTSIDGKTSTDNIKIGEDQFAKYFLTSYRYGCGGDAHGCFGGKYLSTSYKK